MGAEGGGGREGAGDARARVWEQRDTVKGVEWNGRNGAVWLHRESAIRIEFIQRYCYWALL